MVAIIPAAGLGKRMMAVTGGAPKELLPVGFQPVLARVAEEALACGAERVVVVSSCLKTELNAWVEGLRDPRVGLAFQDEQRGLAHAVDCAGVSGESALVLMADSFFHPASPLEALSHRLKGGVWAGVVVRQVPRDQLRQYGVAAFDLASGRVSEFVEKPLPGEEPSDWAVAGRFGFCAEAMVVLRDQVARWDGPGEINLSGVLRAGLEGGKEIVAVPVSPGQELYDCGDPAGYRHACEVFGI